jgi:hypothetical protein
METKTPGKTEADRTLWFSMWFLASIATLGVALFPMFYRLVERRNKHFSRQEKLEKEAYETLKNQEKQSHTVESVPLRNAKLWSGSIILILPIFIITYLLSRDLVRHEKHQETFWNSLFPDPVYMRQNIPIAKYTVITAVTLGVGIIYWLYKIINSYNTHFKQERRIEDRVIRLMEEKRNG